MIPSLLICSLFLSSCFDLYETYTINNDGSYKVAYDLNMGGMMDMLKSVMPDTVKQSKMSFEKDTLVKFDESIPDSVRLKLTDNEKHVMENTQMRMRMNEKEFKIGFYNSGKSLTEMKSFFADFGTVMKKMKLNKTMSGNKLLDDGLGDESNLPINNSGYEYTITQTIFERKLKKETLAVEVDERKKEALEMFKKMKVKMSNTVIINLPRPVTRVEHPKAILSEDKKQVTLVLDLLEDDGKPDLMNFKIVY